MVVTGSVRATMRILSPHDVYRYGQPANGVIQTLRLTPRNHDGQYVVDWRIDISETASSTSTRTRSAT